MGMQRPNLRPLKRLFEMRGVGVAPTAGRRIFEIRRKSDWFRDIRSWEYSFSRD
ncbi:hypothetical protein SAMN04488025_104163 [Planifilum fulgidum]|jgi:hypothetical protein|uniref:Uncharacterized protein n=1 Tax=Planifilum fulgidum TaxID=201973 RepID=A0A1I2L931_9BACL|nr:hypothetical protein SAMN04488025_104163 [Planifilum fulgidum]